MVGGPGCPPIFFQVKSSNGEFWQNLEVISESDQEKKNYLFSAFVQRGAGMKQRSAAPWIRALGKNRTSICVI